LSNKKIPAWYLEIPKNHAPHIIDTKRTYSPCCPSENHLPFETTRKYIFCCLDEIPKDFSNNLARFRWALAQSNTTKSVFLFHLFCF